MVLRARMWCAETAYNLLLHKRTGCAANHECTCDAGPLCRDGTTFTCFSIASAACRSAVFGLIHAASAAIVALMSIFAAVDRPMNWPSLAAEVLNAALWKAALVRQHLLQCESDRVDGQFYTATSFSVGLQAL